MRWPLTASFRGYGPEQGYEFLREAIAENDFHSPWGRHPCRRNIRQRWRQVRYRQHIQEIFDAGARIAIPDPVYPVYLDTNVMAGRARDLIATGATTQSSIWTAMRKTVSSPACPANPWT
jgi:LL-diaminopimelate aminotransferase